MNIIYVWSTLISLTIINAYVAVTQKAKQSEEQFVDSVSMNADEFAPTNQKDNIIVDQTLEGAVWNSLAPLAVDRNATGGEWAKNVYWSGDIPELVQVIIDKAFNAPEFPGETELNTAYEWKAYKPRLIPRNVLETCLDTFMKRSTLHKDRGYYLARYRITHANVSAGGDYLLTLQVIVHKESTMYAKVIEFDVLYKSGGGGSCVFQRVNVVGVVHEQYIGRVAVI